jgi:hypothetical protein
LRQNTTKSQNDDQTTKSARKDLGAIFEQQQI